MSIKSKAVAFVRREVNAEKKRRSDERAGFQPVSQREAWLLEDRLTMRDKQHYCERKAFAQLKYFPNLDRPETYSEKLIWLAMHYRNPRIAQLTDKCEMKKEVASLVGQQYVVPLVGVYESVNDIDFAALPACFAAKSTAGWGNRQVILVPNKNAVNRDRIQSRMAEWLYPWNTYYYADLCITDEKIVPRILLEELLGDGVRPVTDYKLFCFDGVPKIILIVNNRGTAHIQKTFISLDDWTVLPISRNQAGRDVAARKPDKLDELIFLARTLSAGFPLVRVDFYDYGGRIYVGEMTFSPGLFLRINPVEEDRRMGALIHLENLEGCI